MNRFTKSTSLILVLTFLFGIITCAPFSVSAAEHDLVAVSSIEQLGDISVCGNGGTVSGAAGTDNWLNGSFWDPSEKSNVMTEIRENVYSISFSDLPALSNYQFKFLSNYDWYTCNWGESWVSGGSDMEPAYYGGAGKEIDAIFFGANILFDVVNNDSTVEIKLDIAGFDESVLTKYTKNISCGSKYTVNIYLPDGTPINGYGGEEYGDYLFFLSGDDAVVTKYNGSASKVSIPDSIDGHKVVEIGGGAFANNSTVTSVTIPEGVSYIGAHAFSNCAALKTVKLPDAIMRIASKAFSGCANLTSINLSETVTSLEDDTFIDCPKVNIVCIPASYAHTYALENSISFSFDESYNGKVSVKADKKLNGCIVKLSGSDGSLSRSIKDGSALFSGLKAADTYIAELSTKSGRLLEKKEDIKLTDGVAELVFNQNGLYTTSVNVINENGDVISDCQYKWFVNESSEVESSSNQVDNLLDGDKVQCFISINDDLKSLYEDPSSVIVTVNGKDEDVTVKLSKPETLNTKIIIKDESGYPINNAKVSFIQEISNKVNNVINLTTDENGEAAVDLRKVSTTVKASKSGYYEVIKSINPDGADVELILASAVGATFIPSLNTTYLEGVLHSNYTGDGITYSIKNLTTGKDINTFNIDNGIITIPYDSIAQGDRIDFSVIDTHGCFATAKATVKYEKSTTTFDLKLTEKGVITFDYSSQNDKNVALIFVPNGEHITTVDLSNNDQSPNLDAGNYRVVLMGYSILLYQVKSYDDLLSYGLKSGDNFIEKTVSVSDGTVSEIKDIDIPLFSDDALFLIDKSSSYVTYTPANAAPGNYVTVTVGYSLLEQYQNASEVNAVNIKLPDGVKLLDGIRINNRTTTDYSVKDGVLTVLAVDNSGNIRFCLLPEAFISDTISASLEFTYDCKSYSQPIGSAKFSLCESFSVPDLVANADFPLSGTVNKKANVDIYVDGALQKSVKANQLGYFTTGVHLESTFSHTYHSIYFEITSNAGNKYKSSDYSVEYQIDAVTVKKITMSPNGHLDQAVLYDADGEYSPNYFYDPTLSQNLTFSVEFYGDTAKINQVYLVAQSSGNLNNYIPLERIGETNCFSGSSYFDANSIPTYLTIDYYFDDEHKLDYESIQDLEGKLKEQNEALETYREEFIHNYNVLSENDKTKWDNFINSVNGSLKDLNNFVQVKQETNNELLLNLKETGLCYQITSWNDDCINPSDLLSDGYSRIETYNSSNLLYANLSDTKICYTDLSEQSFYSIELKQNGVNDELVATSANLDISDMGSTVSAGLGAFASIVSQISEYIDDIRYLYRLISDEIPYVSPALKPLYQTAAKVLGAIAIGLSISSLCEDVIFYYSMCQSKVDYEIEYEKLKQIVEAKNCGKKELRDFRDALDELGSALNGLNVALWASFGSILFSLGTVLLTITGPALGWTNLISILVGLGVEAAVQISKHNVNKAYSKVLKSHSDLLSALRKCNQPTPDPIPTPTPSPTKFSTPIKPSEDPSGYVCEAVAGNRLEGVTTTLYYSENADGSGAEIWDAEDFSQQNPLITDSQGRYQWYVPEGYWQVKYEKDGYETTYSDWLPVPPPQLDVNVAMTSMEAPAVQNIKVYSDSIDITFSQYMDLDTVNTDNITITVGDQEIEGKITPINTERSFVDAGASYASKFVFKPTANTALSDSVTVSISGVRNYVGSGIDEDFTSGFEVEYRVSSIEVEEELSVNYGEPQTVTLSLNPDEAAAGKTIIISTENSSILSIDKNRSVTDDNGIAKILVSALLPGTAKINYKVEGTDVTATTIVNCTNIRPSEPEKLDRVTASIASGTAVKKGTKITLSSSNTDAQIYYTLDLSCPCQANNPARTLYTEPIEVSENMNIIAYAVLDGYEESNTILFTYTVLPDVLLGDVDGDGEVTIIDATYIQRKLASIPIPFEFDDNVADTDEDSSVTIIDATYIQRWLASLTSNDNIGKPMS